MSKLNTDDIRALFPALQAGPDGREPLVLDGPGGSQVPRQVAEAMSAYLLSGTANLGGPYDTSQATGELVRRAREAAADLLCADSDEIMFGANATSLLFSTSRALARNWQAGDEIIVTALDHEANISPWRLAAAERGVTVLTAGVRRDDGSLDLEHLASMLGPRTRLVAFSAASNVTGTRVDAQAVCKHVRAASDALTCVDAVHLAPHSRIDVAAIGCDLLVTSAYKYFGPHIGVLYGRAEALAAQAPFKVAPATNTGPGRWETGTQNFEGMAGFVAAVNYLASLAPTRQDRGESRSQRLTQAFDAIDQHERALSRHFLERVRRYPAIRLFGVTDPGSGHRRTPTFAMTVAGHGTREIAHWLGERDVRVGSGNFYAPGLYRQLDIDETDGVLRTGFMHYHGLNDVDRFFDILEAHPAVEATGQAA